MHLLAGNAPAAATDAAESLAIDPAGGNASSSLWVAVMAGSVLRDPAVIRAALDATSGLRGQWTRLVRSTAHASLGALEDQPGATAAMQSALDAWSAADLPLDHAFATLCAQHVLPAELVPDADVQRARACLEERRAEALLHLYDAAATSNASDHPPLPTP